MRFHHALFTIISSLTIPLAGCAADDAATSEDLDEESSEVTSATETATKHCIYDPFTKHKESCVYVFSNDGNAYPAFDKCSMLSVGQVIAGDNGGIQSATASLSCDGGRTDNRDYQLVASLESCANGGCTILSRSVHTITAPGEFRSLELKARSREVAFTRQAYYRARACANIVNPDGGIYRRGPCVTGPLDRM